MVTIDDSKFPYMNRFNPSKQWSKILFAPSVPLQQSELNELQSIAQSQLKLLGDSVFKDGSIISGMSIHNLGKASTGGNTSSTLVNDNLISLSTLKAINASIDTSSFKGTGLTKVTNKAVLPLDISGMQFSIAPDGTNNNLTLRFKVSKTSGTLYKITGSYPDTLVQQRFLIDGIAIQNKFNETTSGSLIDTNGQQVNINDSKTHEFILTFKTTSTQAINFQLLANIGYSAINEGAVNVNIDELKMEYGETATAWSLNPQDVGIPDQSERDVTIRVDDGRLYLAGMVRIFNQQEIAITGVGNEILGVKISEEIITADQDTSLLDSTQGAVSEFGRGADRLKYTVQLTYNDPEATPFATLTNGKIVDNNTKPDYSVLFDILAKRTNDESGSYRVRGFDMWTEKNDQDTSKINLIVDSGLAYIQGYEVTKGVSTKISLDKAIDTATQDNEGFYYNSNNDDNGILANQPVKAVNRVTGSIQIVGEAVTRGGSAQSDILKNSSVYRIDKVYVNSTVYQEGVDFKLQNGSEIVWGVTTNSKIPTTGSTYYVTYEYTKVLVLNTDYEVVTSGGTDTKVTQIVFQGMKGDKPMPNSLVYVDYTYFLARVDLISLNRYGKFAVIKGQPSPLSKAQPPKQEDIYTLRLGFVTVYPNSDTGICELNTVTRLPFSELQRHTSRIENLEYNSAVTDLNNGAMANEDPTTLRGVFSDAFNTVEKADVSNKEFTASYSLEDGEITLPYTAVSTINPDVSDTASEIHKFAHMVTAPFTEEPTVNQPLATGVLNINPYQVFNVMGSLGLNPSVDNWIDTKKTTVTVDGTPIKVSMNRFWMHNGNMYDQTADWYNKITLDDGQSWTANDGNQPAKTGTIIESGGTNTMTRAIEYMRQREVKFTAHNLTPLADNLQLTFDSKPVFITPSVGYSAGAQPGTIRAKLDGTASGTFTIPAGIRTGTREVVLFNPDNKAVQVYSAQGTLKTVEAVIKRTRVTVNLYDPLAQSFTFDSNKVVPSVELYFATKAETVIDGHTSDVTVQIRTLGDEGYPTQKILAEKTLTPDEIKVSEDASAGTKVVFDDPVMCDAGKGYCITIITDSADYNMWIAEMGKTRVDAPNQTVTAQPYVNGTLFMSANAQTWTANQTSDLKFIVNTAVFNDNAIVIFDTIYPKKEYFTDDNGQPILDDKGQKIPVTIDKLVLLASYLTPDNTGCSWEIKLVLDNQPSDITVDNVEWQPLTNYFDMDLLSHAREIKLKATFAVSKYVSPLLSIDDLTLAGMLTSLKGSYLSRNIDMSDAPYNNVKVQFEGYIPKGATITPRWSMDGGATWNKFDRAPDTRAVNRDFVRYIYQKQLWNSSTGDTHTADKFKVRLDFEASTSFLRPRARKLMTTMINK